MSFLNRAMAIYQPSVVLCVGVLSHEGKGYWAENELEEFLTDVLNLSGT